MLASSQPKKKRAGRKKSRETPHPVYWGVRLSNGGKWVSEVVKPNKKSRICLGTFPMAEMAARAHDVGALALIGRSACLNFADSAWRLPVLASADSKDIQKAAAEAAEAFQLPEEFSGVSGDDMKPEETMTLREEVFFMDEEAVFGMPELLINMDEEAVFGMPELLINMDEEAVFGMPGLLINMAEGLLLPPPHLEGYGHNEDDMEAEQVGVREQNNDPVTCSDKAQEPDSSHSQSTISSPGLEVIQNAHQPTLPHTPEQQLTVEVHDIDNENSVNAEQNNTRDPDANSITYEELEKHFGKKLVDVAQILGVSRSTFKRICRKNGISRWSRSKRKNVESSPSRQGSLGSDLYAKKLEVRTTTIKAKYEGLMIKFQLASTSRMEDLEEEVFKRLKLDVGTYNITYDDGEDRILIACDEDLLGCMNASNSLGMNTIKMFIELVAKVSPS